MNNEYDTQVSSIRQLVDQIATNGGSLVAVLSGEERIVAEAAQAKGLITIRADGGAWEESEVLSLTRRVRMLKGLPPIIEPRGPLQNAARIIAGVWASLRPWKA